MKKKENLAFFHFKPSQNPAMTYSRTERPTTYCRKSGVHFIPSGLISDKIQYQTLNKNLKKKTTFNFFHKVSMKNINSRYFAKKKGTYLTLSLFKHLTVGFYLAQCAFESWLQRTNLVRNFTSLRKAKPKNSKIR